MAPKHTILYAEDDLDDLFLVKQAFTMHNATIEVVHAHNGFEALEFLNGLQGDPLPCLVILDINMPGMDGRETLIRIRQSGQFKTIPVVMFSTSSSKMDKDFAAKWGAGFITKPLVYEELETLARQFVDLCDFEISKRA